MKYLFIAEKTSVMQAVQQTYQKHRQEICGKIGGDIEFSALSGHVCRYLEPSEYKCWKNTKWRNYALPLVPEPFEIVEGKEKRQKSIVEHIRSVMSSGRCQGIIVGTDSDTEGNGIFYLLSNVLKLQDYPTLRFFEQSLTDTEILDSLLHMTDFYKEPRDVRMTQQYIIRSHFDWLVGMNATIGLTVKSGDLLKVGRVKAPTLKLVYDNSAAIRDFVPHSDFQPQAVYREGFTGLLVDEQDEYILFPDREKAEAFNRELKETNAEIVKIERKKKKTRPGSLYKLSALQGEAGSRFNYAPSDVLATVQSLYEKKILSYPRTDGTFVSEEKAKDFEGLLKAASAVPSLAEHIAKISPEQIRKTQKDRNVVNDQKAKAASHEPLLPTLNVCRFETLSKKEQDIFEMVCRRFAAQFLPQLEEEKTVLTAKAGDAYFRSNGSRVTEKGWTVLYDRKSKAETIPTGLKKGDMLTIDHLDVHEKVSEPPKRLTEASLVTAMENISRYIEDKELAKTMRSGIGTQATRASIIEDLKKTGYIRSEGKARNLFITDLGEKYIDTVRGFSIIDPQSAAVWETMFLGVKEGSVSFDEAKAKTSVYVNRFVDEIHGLSEQKKLCCPYCGGALRKFTWGYACENFREGRCGFAVNNHGGKLLDEDFRELLRKGSTRKIPELVTKEDGTAADAGLRLNRKGGAHAVSYWF